MDCEPNLLDAQVDSFKNHTDTSPYREIVNELQPSASSCIKTSYIQSNYAQKYNVEDEVHHLPSKQKSVRRVPRKFSRARPLTEEELDRKRVTANVQERRRMQRLNTALEKLKRAIPQHLHMQYRRLSKIKTLKLAIDYIGFLEEILQPNFRQQLCANSSQLQFYEADGATAFNSEVCETSNAMLEDEGFLENDGHNQTSLELNSSSVNCASSLQHNQCNAYFADIALPPANEGFHYLEQF